MSKIIPQRLVNGLRQCNDIAVDIYGQSCRLHVPTNLDAVDLNDTYAEPADYQYREYDALVYVEWAVSDHRLRSMGLFTETKLPILAYFSNRIYDNTGFRSDVVILPKSWFLVPMQFIPDTYDRTNLEFEVLGALIPSKHDAVVKQVYEIAPRRYKR